MIYDIALSLRLNVDELTRTHLQTAESAHSIDGQTLIERNSGQVPGLIEQLRDSCREGIGGNGGASGFAPKIPIQVGAYMLYESIEKTAGAEWERLTGRRPHATVEQDILGWADFARRDPTEQEHCLNITDQWINDIGELLNPPRRWEISHPCPACNEKFVYRVMDGETTRSAALVVTAKDGGLAECRSCAASWASEEWAELAASL